jgi:hypothetical protein
MHFVIGYAVKIPDSTSWFFVAFFAMGRTRFTYALSILVAIIYYVTCIYTFMSKGNDSVSPSSTYIYLHGCGTTAIAVIAISQKTVYIPNNVLQSSESSDMSTTTLSR